MEPLIKQAADRITIRTVSDGTRTGAPFIASGLLSLSLLRWNAGEADICLSALPIQPSVSSRSAEAACQMSIERKCDWLGFG